MRRLRRAHGRGPADGDRLSVLQEASSAEHGLQCGFGTPGFLTLLPQALDDDPDLDRDERKLDEVLAANLCRCTGYVGIRNAVVRPARTLRGEPAAD